MSAQLPSIPPSTSEFVKELGLRFRSVVIEPAQFFQNLDLNEKVREPLTFCGTIIISNSVFMLLLTRNLSAFVYTLLGLPTALCLSCGLLHLCAKRLGGTGNYTNMLRAFVYANAPMLLAWLPIINFFAWCYSLYLAKLAVERAEQLQAPRSNVAVMITAGIVIIILVLYFLLPLIFLAKKETNSGGY